MNQVRKTVLLLAGAAAAAAGFGLYAYYGVAKPEEKEAARKDAAAKLVQGAFVPTALTVTAKGETTVLERVGDKWRMVSPVKADADAFAVDAIASALQTAKFKDLIEEHPTEADLSRYGLVSPAFSIAAQGYAPDAQDGGASDPSRHREVKLVGGIENTFDGSVYVRRDGEAAVRSIEGGTRWSFEKTAFDLRDKDVFTLDEPALDRIDVKAKANRYTLERDAQHAWRLVSPVKEPADVATLSAMMSTLKAQRATAFPQEPAAFDSPQVDATFTPAKGAAVRLRLVPQGKDALVFKESADGQVVARVPEAALTALDKNPQDLRDHSVLAFKREDAARLSFKKGQGPAIAVEKASPDAGEYESWRVVAPQSGPAKKWRVSSLLWALSSLKAAAIDEVSPKSWTKYGLDTPEQTVDVMDAHGKSLAKLWVGKPVPNKPGSVYVRGSQGAAMEIEASRLGDFPAEVADLLDAPDAGVAAAN